MISIVCPVHNKLEYTKKCLESLNASIAATGYPDRFEIVLVDDGSTDGTEDFVRNNYPEVRVLTGDGNLWWSGGMNMGARDALARGAEYILLINNDNTFETDFLEKLVEFTKQEQFKLVGALVMDVKTGQPWAYGGFLDMRTGALGMYDKPKVPNVDHYAVDLLPGMGTLIHKSVFKKIGFWDSKKFPQYFGDSDFTLRAKECGFQPYIFFGARLWNDTRNTGDSLHGGSFKKMVNSLFSIRSHYNMVTTYKFLRCHDVGFLAIVRHFIFKHGRFVGGFFKHKILRTKY